jgi:hypothetical protein
LTGFCNICKVITREGSHWHIARSHSKEMIDGAMKAGLDPMIMAYILPRLEFAKYAGNDDEGIKYYNVLSEFEHRWIKYPE